MILLNLNWFGQLWPRLESAWKKTVPSIFRASSRVCFSKAPLRVTALEHKYKPQMQSLNTCWVTPWQRLKFALRQQRFPYRLQAKGKDTFAHESSSSNSFANFKQSSGGALKLMKTHCTMKQLKKNFSSFIWINKSQLLDPLCPWSKVAKAKAQWPEHPAGQMLSPVILLTWLGILRYKLHWI